MIKVLQLLLIVRVVATPVTLQPADGDQHWRILLVARTCAWAAHQSQARSPSVDEGRGLRAIPGSPIGTVPVGTSPLVSGPSLASPAHSLVHLDGHAQRPPARLRC